MPAESSCAQSRGSNAGWGDAVYAELRPLGRHRGFLDHLYILKDDGRLAGAGRHVFASPLCDIALARRDDLGSPQGGERAGGWTLLQARPRFGQTQRRRAFCGWMIGIRCQPPGFALEEQRAMLGALAGVFTGIVQGQTLLDGIIHALDLWIGSLARPSVLPQAGQALSMPIADCDPRVAARAAAAGMSPRTLRRHVRAGTGLGPKRYASLQRFSAALRQLAHDDASLARVAAESGYSDHAHMTMELTRHAGMSPGRFRALARGQIQRDAGRFFKDDELRSRVRLLVCDSSAPVGAAMNIDQGQHGQ